jgi:molybdate transport system substrate-binding protein
LLLSWLLLAYRKGRSASAALVCLVVCLGVVLGGQHAWGQKELRVAAAADLQPVMPMLAQEYEKATGVKLVVSFGSSSALVTQILNGAPFDIFLAADYVFPEKVVIAGLADGGEPKAYAKGTLVLWTRKDSGLLPLSLDTLSDPRVKTIAIANELHAPYGRAAAAALRNMKLYDKLAPHFVVGENISQTAQFVESGNAQLGLISLTAASTQHFKEIGTYILVPTSQYPSIRQCAVIMGKSEHKAEAHAFLDWLLSPAIQGELPTVGLGPVQ